MYRWIGGIAVAVVVLVVGVGCGGGSEDTTPEISKAQFVKKANFICAEFNGKRKAWAEEEFNPKQRQGSHVVGSPALKALQAELKVLGEELVTEKIVPSMREEQEKLESIGAPRGDEEKVEDMLQSFEEGTDKLEERGLAGLLDNQFDQFDRESNAYGLNCSFT